MTMEIPLTQGKVALVDDEDYPLISQFRWYAHLQYEVWYARTRYPKWKDHKGTPPPDKKTYMHRMVLGVSDPAQKIDHINHDGLDNRRENLRICTPSENLYNMRKIAPASSKYRGVYWGKGDQKWKASATYCGKKHNLGSFESEIEAAKGYNKYVLEHNSGVYILNQIEDVTEEKK